MIDWINNYPHAIYASAFLKDSKIFCWQIGEEKWDYPLEVTRIIELPYNEENHKNETIKCKSWMVNNDDEHIKIFNILAPEWFKQWEIHEELYGKTPYEYSELSKKENVKPSHSCNYGISGERV